MAQFRNHLLSALSPSDATLLTPFLEPITLALNHPLEEADAPIKAVYFMESGIASVVAVGEQERRIEIGLVGREGMTGMAVVLGGRSSPHETYIQVAGDGQWITAKKLRATMGESGSLTALFLLYAQAFMVQTAHTAVANARGKVDERLARWLLMAQDRVGEDDLPLKHKFLALMLGVRRAGVTTALAVLEGEELIRARRGKITVIDRAALERRAGGFYRIPEAEFRRLIP